MGKSIHTCKCGKTINSDYEYCEDHCIHNNGISDWKDTSDDCIWCRHCGATEVLN